MCFTRINELCYKLFDHTLCGISISIEVVFFTVLNDNKNNLQDMFPKMTESVGSPQLEKRVMLRVSKSKRRINKRRLSNNSYRIVVV
jgi:hypothetical protein